MEFVLVTNLTYFFNVFISHLYVLLATHCSSSGESVVSVHCLVYITLCRWPSGMQTCIPEGHLHRVIYTRCCNDTIDSPDAEHWVTWSTYILLMMSTGLQKWNKHIKKVRQIGY